MKTITEYKIGNFWIVWQNNKPCGYLYSQSEVEAYLFNAFLEG